MNQEQIVLADKLEQGKLGLTYLKRIWSEIILERKGLLDPKDKTKLNYVTSVFDSLGIGLEPTYQYLFMHAPSFEAFEDWIITNGTISKQLIEFFNTAILDGGHSVEDTKIEKPVLSTKDITQFERDGFVIVKNAIPKQDCEDTVKLIEEFLEIDLDDNSTWYKHHPAKKGIMVQFFMHPLLMKNRLSPKIRTAFLQLWKRNDLLVSIDRVSFNPPENELYQFPGPDLHWDVSLKTPIPFGLQGILYLSDTPENQGAFTLVPGFHQKIESWLKSLPEGAHPREEDLHQLGAKPIAAQAGDFIIWHHALPHGSSPNSGTQPRIVQYINYRSLNREIRTEWI